MKKKSRREIEQFVEGLSPAELRQQIAQVLYEKVEMRVCGIDYESGRPEERESLYDDLDPQSCWSHATMQELYDSGSYFPWPCQVGQLPNGETCYSAAPDWLEDIRAAKELKDDLVGRAFVVNVQTEISDFDNHHTPVLYYAIYVRELPTSMNHLIQFHGPKEEEIISRAYLCARLWKQQQEEDEEEEEVKP